TGTRSAEGIMASGHVNRINRPNTWLHRPAKRREVFPCQPGAVHTWRLADMVDASDQRPLCVVDSADRGNTLNKAFCRCHAKENRPRPSVRAQLPSPGPTKGRPSPAPRPSFIWGAQGTCFKTPLIR